jgi:hypothetical protein
MKRTIAVTEVERTMIIAALMMYGAEEFAFRLDREFLEADPANDGPEVAILSVEPIFPRYYGQ